MRLLLLFIILAGGLYVYPSLREGADGSCAAVRNRFARLLREDLAAGHPPPSPNTAAIIQGMAGGRVAAGALAARFPDLPPSAICLYVYWRSVLSADPAKFLSANQ